MFEPASAFIVIIAVLLAFCAGLIVPVLARRAKQGGLSQWVWRRAGYFASFGAGALLTLAFVKVAMPYDVAHWLNVYEDAVVGDAILADERTMQTGQIPEHVLEWYRDRQAP